MDPTKQRETEPPRSRPWVLWDGDCRVCAWLARWIGNRDRAHRLHLVPYQEAPNPPVGGALREAASHSIHVLMPDGTTHRAGRACLLILSRLGFERTARVLVHRPILWAVEIGYWLTARSRGVVGRLLPRPP